MKSFSVYYVKSELDDRVKKAFKLCPIEAIPDSPWLVCNYNKDGYGPDDDVLLGERSLTAAKSEGIGEMIYLYSSKPDCFVYEHSDNGKLLRKLVWYPMLDDFWNPGWISVSGEKEEWEEILFRFQDVDTSVEKERGMYEELGKMDEFPDHENEIRQVWKERNIKANLAVPEADFTLAFTVEKHFGLKRPESA